MFLNSSFRSVASSERNPLLEIERAFDLPQHQQCAIVGPFPIQRDTRHVHAERARRFEEPQFAAQRRRAPKRVPRRPAEERLLAFHIDATGGVEVRPAAGVRHADRARSIATAIRLVDDAHIAVPQCIEVDASKSAADRPRDSWFNSPEPCRSRSDAQPFCRHIQSRCRRAGLRCRRSGTKLIQCGPVTLNCSRG